MKVMGIDPGITGGIVVLNENGFLDFAVRTPVVQFGSGAKRQYDVQAMACLVRDVGDTCAELIVSIERVGAMPNDGKVGAFNFGKGYGLWLGICAAIGIPYVEVTPQRWQARMLAGLPRGKNTKTSAVTRAKSLFPNIPLKAKADWGMADAALIAEYLREVRKGEI